MSEKARTREAIQREALRLMASRGYDAMTCAQIAAAADVSPATLFRYFATKEDIVLQDGYDPLIAEALRTRPAAEDPLTAVRRGFADAFADVYQRDLEVIRQRTALILSVARTEGTFAGTAGKRREPSVQGFGRARRR
jgi:AcrR family transcriptional regulator